MLVDSQRQLTHLHASLHMSSCAPWCVCSDIDDLRIHVSATRSVWYKRVVWCVWRTLVTQTTYRPRLQITLTSTEQDVCLYIYSVYTAPSNWSHFISINDKVRWYQMTICLLRNAQWRQVTYYTCLYSWPLGVWEIAIPLAPNKRRKLRLTFTMTSLKSSRSIACHKSVSLRILVENTDLVAFL